MNDTLKHTDPHWHGNLLVVHTDEVRAALDKLPPDVEMRVQNIISNAHHVRRPGFILAFTIGTDPYDLTTRDLEYMLDALEGLGYELERPAAVPPSNVKLPVFRPVEVAPGNFVVALGDEHGPLHIREEQAQSAARALNETIEGVATMAARPFVQEMLRG